MKSFVDKNGRNCTSCNTYKTWEHYSKRKGSTSKHSAQCKTCLYASQNEKRKQKTAKSEANHDPSGICFDLANKFILGGFRSTSGESEQQERA